MFDAISFLDAYHIPYWADGKNSRPGWVQIQCPMCDDSSSHGGFNLKKGYYNCWKCGHEYTDKIIKEILGISVFDAKKIEKEYTKNYVREHLNEKRRSNNTSLKLPTGTKELQQMHIKYLQSRNFDPDELIKMWNVKGTTHIWNPADGDYRFRVIAPIYVKGQLVSFQGRDVSGKAELRYKACQMEKEVIYHKDIVYGIDHIKNKKAIGLEGITDAWRIGHGAVCTFGTSYTNAQINFMSKNIDYLFLLSDPEYTARKKFEKLSYSLSGLGVKVEIIETDFNGDPGEMKQDDAVYLRKELLGY